MARVRILHTNPALGPLDYRVPHGMTVEPGQVVRVPLGPREMVGVVWEEAALPTETVGDNRLRNIIEAYDLPPLGAPLRRLIEWTADYYLAPPQSVLRMALSSMAALEGGRTVQEYRLTGRTLDKLTPQRAQAIDRIGERQGLIRELAEIADVSEGVIRGLVKAGVIEGVEVALDTPFVSPDPDHAPPQLSAAQQAAADDLVGLVRAQDFAPVLLDGVTGSGKTEVYFEAVAEALRAGRQTLVLLPEIALTEPFLRRFIDRFGHAPVSWHSDLRQSQRRRAYRAIATGEALVTVGARSALYLPYRNLGLIVIGEAHETSFKQEDGVQYHARDAAVMRGHFEKAPVILATATPAIETRQQVAQGRYKEVKLPGRYGA
ncbi:MAG: hypothetical protein RIT52_360, partial [Pseudomonadota bacterium]